MNRFQLISVVAALLASGLAAEADAQSVAGIQLYPGASNRDVEDSERTITSSGYPTAVCRHTPDSLDKVVAFYRKDKQLSEMYKPTQDNAGFANKAGASMSINSPWMNIRTLQMTNGTMICIASKNPR